jgi:hypothetical protein
MPGGSISDAATQTQPCPEGYSTTSELNTNEDACLTGPDAVCLPGKTPNTPPCRLNKVFIMLQLWLSKQ